MSEVGLTVSTSGWPNLSTRQHLPSLDQVLAFLLDQPKKDFRAYVEMKTGRSRRINDALAESVVASINRHKLGERAIVISFNLPTVARVKQLDASIRTGALFGPRQRATRSTRKMKDAAISSGAEEILFHRLLATPQAIAQATAAGLKSAVWTVDDPKWIERGALHGIHALITNNPAGMIEYRER